MQQVNGICINGPYAGLSIAHMAREIELERMGKSSFTYAFVEVPGNSFGFWVPKDKVQLGLGYVLGQLCECYVSAFGNVPRSRRPKLAPNRN